MKEEYAGREEQINAEEDDNNNECLTDDEVETNSNLLKYRVVNKRVATPTLQKHFKRVDDHMLEKDKEGRFIVIALWIIDAIVMATSGTTKPYYT